MSAFTLCHESGALAVAGACPVHHGDACLRQYEYVNDTRRAAYEECAKLAENCNHFTGCYGGDHDYGRGGRYARERIVLAIREAAPK